MLYSRNTHLRALDTQLLRERFRGMMSSVLSRLSSGAIETEEQFITEFSSSLSQFEDVLVNYYRPLDRVREGNPPLSSELIDTFVDLNSELGIILRGVEDLEALTISNFNRAVSLGSRVESDIRKLSSDLSTYTLYVDDTLSSVNYLSDSFGNIEQVDFASSLLSVAQASVFLNEGMVTLPEKASESQKVKVKQFVLNRPSNGLPGNNYDSARSRNSDPNKIFDDNPDTWFEFERLNNLVVPEPLILDFNLILEANSIINHIHITPMNFRERITPLKIVAIDTSLDGEDWLSVLDDQPIADYKSEDPENIFVLSPASIRYASEGYFTFTPRKAKYIHFKFLQEHPYRITGLFGERQRYAIGIREIEIVGKKYETKGELISKSYNLGKQIKKVSLRSAQNPVAPSVLADIKHLVSVDDGATWHELQPQDRGDTGVPEVLDEEVFGTNPSTSLRYKAIFERNPEAFRSVAQSENSSVQEKIDVFNYPAVSPHTVTLSSVPITGTIEVIDPNYGSVGKKYPKMKLGTGTGGNELVLPIPDFIVQGIETKDDIEIYVDNSKWLRIGNFSALDPWTGGALGATSRVYYIDADWQVVFGDGSGTKGKVPPSGSSVSMTLPQERISLTGKEPYRAITKFPFDKDKSTFSIRRGGSQKTEYSVLIPPGVTEFFLGHKNIVEPPDASSEYTFAEFHPETGFPQASTAFADEVAFIDGAQELNLAGKYSIDYVNGMLYLTTATSTSNVSRCAFYHYYDYVDLDKSEFDFVEGDSQAIEIKPSAYVPTQRTKAGVAAGSRVITLEPSVVPGSVVLPSAFFSVGNQEVQFIDGIQELSSLVKITDEEVPEHAGPGVVNFDLIHQAKVIAGYAPGFSDRDVFTTEKAFVDGSTELVDDGDYSIDYTGATKGRVFVQLAVGANTGGTVSYYIEDPDILAARQGTYSVDYLNGIIYLATATEASGNISYRTTEYYVKYNIVRLVDGFTNEAGSREVGLPEETTSSFYSDYELGYRKLIKVRYKTNKTTFRTIEELEPYFTPILKDYTLLVIDKDQLLFS